MCDFLINPLKNKKAMDTQRSIGILIIESILSAISVIIAANKLPASLLTSDIRSLAVGAFALAFFGILYISYILELIMKVFGSKVKYKEALAVMVNSYLPASIGVFVASILSYIPTVGLLLSFIVLAPLVAIGYALMFRLIKTVYKTDMITSLIVVTVMWFAVLVSMYSLVFFGIGGFTSMTKPVLY